MTKDTLQQHKQPSISWLYYTKKGHHTQQMPVMRTSRRVNTNTPPSTELQQPCTAQQSTISTAHNQPCAAVAKERPNETHKFTKTPGKHPPSTYMESLPFHRCDTSRCDAPRLLIEQEAKPRILQITPTMAYH